MTRRTVIEWKLHEDDFRKSVSRKVAKEFVDVWIWCNVYPVSLVSVTEHSLTCD